MTFVTHGDITNGRTIVMITRDSVESTGSLNRKSSNIKKALKTFLKFKFD